MASNDSPRFLLLLPAGPRPPTYTALKAAYEDTLVQVLKEVASHSAESTSATVLEIALACPHLCGKRDTPRSTLYDSTQSLLSTVYKLICITATKNSVNVEDADGVDVRVLLIGWSPDGHVHATSDKDASLYGPIVSLETLAQSGRPWRYAFGVESEEGEAFVRAFIAAKGSGEQITRVQGGPVSSTSPNTATREGRKGADSQADAEMHYHVAVGGTFDHIHIGHKLLLTMTVFAVDEGYEQRDRSATIGITGDQLLKNKKHAEVLESWEDRYRSVMTFVNALIDFAPPSAPGQRHVSVKDDPGPNGKSMDVQYPNRFVVKCTEIQDPYGPTITEEQISCLIISAETRSGGKAVNDRRAEKGWKGLEVFEVDVLDAEEVEDQGSNLNIGFESKLSSTAIREKIAQKRHSSL